MRSVLRMNTIYLIFIYEKYKLYVNDITYYETKYVFQTRKLRKRDIQCCSNVKYHVTVFGIVKMVHDHIAPSPYTLCSVNFTCGKANRSMDAKRWGGVVGDRVWVVGVGGQY